MNEIDQHARNVAERTANEVAETKAEARVRLDRIESLLGYVTSKILLGQPLLAADTPILDFFGISSKNPDPIAMIRARGAKYGKKLGVVECPSCGSNVQDIEGVLDETCGFCGAKVTTAT